MLVAAKDSKTVKRMVYAASSSTYGDHPGLPKVEDKIGKSVLPYAINKYINELYAEVFYKTFVEKTDIIVFLWPKQDSNRDCSSYYTFFENVVQANIKAVFSVNRNSINQVYNVAFGENINLCYSPVGD